MDSMFHGQVAHQIKGQICSVVNSDKKELKTVALLVQQISIMGYFHWNLFITFYQKRKHPLR